MFAGRYEIIEELGKGGMGKVYRAFDKEIGEEVALKVLHPEIALDPKNPERKLIHPLYYYRLGKLYERKGNKGKARARYERFLVLWKDADPGQPEFEDAKNRLAKLKNFP